MKTHFPKRLSITFCLLAAVAATHARAAGGPSGYLEKPAAWYTSAEAKTIATNVLTWQSDLGGWPKNVNTAAKPYAGTDRATDLHPTYDNGATTGEIRFLALMYNANKDPAYKTAFEKGFDYVLIGQYPTGGWPQFYPPDDAYHRYITFNDNAMINLMNLIRDVYTLPTYAFVDDARKAAAKKSFNAGVECILKCQIKVDGKLTAWCAQHDEKDYSARPGRTFELKTLSGDESVGITRLLMSLDNPSPEVIQSVDAAVAWFDAVKMENVRVEDPPDPSLPRGHDRVIVPSPGTKPLWARFYEIGTNRPVYADRDGIAHYSLAEVGPERRSGYSWAHDWPAMLIKKEYPAWKKKVAANTTQPAPITK